MQSKTRDNLIYLAVGLSIAGLLAADAFYSQAHERTMWMPSRFAFRVTATTGLLAYYVVRQMIKEAASLAQVAACVLFATFLHLGIAFTFRQMIGQLPGMSFSALAVLEIFLVVNLTLRIGVYLRSES